MLWPERLEALLDRVCHYVIDHAPAEPEAMVRGPPGVAMDSQDGDPKTWS